MTDTPLFADPLFGLRFWSVTAGDSGELLSAPHRDDAVWPPGGQWLHAQCPTGHVAPAAGCDCGAHAWHPRPRSARDVLAVRGAIAGIVEAEGAVEVHEDGLRAARGRPYALIATPVSNRALIDRLAERYGAIVLELSGPGALLAWCREHDIGMDETVVAQLLGIGNPRERRRARFRREAGRVAVALAVSSLLVVVGLAVVPDTPDGKTLSGRSGEVRTP